VRALDFALRLVFFAVVPYLATLVSARFPVAPVLANVAAMLVIFAGAEAVRGHAKEHPILELLLRRHLLFEQHYRAHPPRPFLFYVFYPLLLPWVLSRPETRRELWLYRGIGAGGVALLAAVAVGDWFVHWPPELHFGDFAWRWAVLLAVQTAMIFLFLMPVATTVVKLHLERRMRALWLLLGVASVSVAVAAGSLLLRHAPVVSWVTTQRVGLRTKAAPQRARAAELDALRAVWGSYGELLESTDAEGWVEGDALGRAEERLALFYKSDEAWAFTLHALPPKKPEVLVLLCQLGRDRTPIWRAMRRSGQEITSPEDLPAGVLGLPRRKLRRAVPRRARGSLLGR
jgi:hypothetical protein